jgi:hypothetical protein
VKAKSLCGDSVVPAFGTSGSYGDIATMPHGTVCNTCGHEGVEGDEVEMEVAHVGGKDSVWTGPRCRLLLVCFGRLEQK